MLSLFVLSLVAFVSGELSTYHAPHESPIYGPLVYLMDWKYTDVAKECSFLKNYGFGAVVVSPPTEHVMSSANSPWSERYEVISYSIGSRSGSALEFGDMVQTCIHNNVKTIVDIVLNNMASTSRGEITGTRGSKANPKNYVYPNFKKSDGHFNDPCSTIDYNDPKQVRDCEIKGLADLKSNHRHVRKEQVSLMNYLLIEGVSGFYVDKARFIWPWELAVRQTKLRNTRYPRIKRPFMLFNVEDNGAEAGKYGEYVDLGRVTDYKYGMEVTKWFTTETNFFELIKKDKLFPDWIPSENALVFLTNVNSHMDSKLTDVLRYNENPELYKLATAFMLAYNHGMPLVLSTYKMAKPYSDAGPPANAQGDILSPGNECKGGWNCEHRLPEVYRMALFNLDCLGQDVRHQFQGPSTREFAFGRGDRGFVAFNLGQSKWIQKFTTSLPSGEYCEIITGGITALSGKYCRKDAIKITVDATGTFLMEIPGMSVRAIHIWNKLNYRIDPMSDEPRIPFYEITGLFNNLKYYFSISGTAEITPTAAPALGSPPPRPGSQADSSDIPLPGTVHVRANGPH